VDLCRANFALHRAKWEALGVPQPVVIQGDSRRLRAVLAGADGCVSSPPYAESNMNISHDHGACQKVWREAVNVDGYGQTSGQLGAMKEGDVAAALGSIGRMAEGEFQGCVTSPPYENGQDRRRPHGGHVADGEGGFRGYYSNNPANLGNPQGVDAPETYWVACRQIYAEVFALLRPGGHIALICKDYVRDKQRQPLCDRTWALLQHVGFLPVTRIYAMLGRKWKEELLTGETVEREKSRKSFFRRLAERKGSPRIDWEEVLVMQKPATAVLDKAADAPLFEERVSGTQELRNLGTQELIP
jgi:hypothetical protein